MPEIQVLSQAVADKIAAGEVAERPSAVVKELVENALDAGADRIEVEISRGGVGLIRVTDNGCGIPAEQAERAFLRHATSKLTEIEDLERLCTMGFRGEALASICAVSEVEVITKTKDAEEGVCLAWKHGELQEKSEIACADGTTMLVRNLFANVPARMKFLKKNATEAGYVTDMLTRIALSRPDVAFSCLCDGKEVLSTSGDGSLVNVILKLYGIDHAKGSIPVDYTEDGIRVHGVAGQKELARGNRTRQTLFVNGRYVKNHVVSKVVEEAYRNLIMVGRFPFFVISLELPATLVDVNVHPAKTEVKFADEKQIYDIVYHGVRNALYRQMPQPQEKPQEKPQEEAPGHTASSARLNDAAVSPALVRKYMESTMPQSEPIPVGDAERKLEELLEQAESVPKHRNENNITDKNSENSENNKIIDNIDNTIEETPVKQEAFAPTVRILGQVFDTYIVCQRGEEMFLIDQHAAHERFRFEQLRKSYLNRERLTQMLLCPMVLQLDYREKQAIMEEMAEFVRFGFDIEDFGNNAVIVHGTPIPGSEGEIRDLILELAEALREQRRHPVADFEEKALDKISCKGAVKANRHLNLAEMQDLAEKVLALEQEGATTCPHGRPLKITFTKTELEKLFRRKP